MKISEAGRADVEVTIQIGAETEHEAVAMFRDGRRIARRLLALDPKPEAKEEKQWCYGAMRVIVRRPNMETK